LEKNTHFLALNFFGLATAIDVNPVTFVCPFSVRFAYCATSDVIPLQRWSCLRSRRDCDSLFFWTASQCARLFFVCCEEVFCRFWGAWTSYSWASTLFRSDWRAVSL
jgi:hypothetical protein